MDAGTDDEIDRLERHLVETFVHDYIARAMGQRAAVKINASAIYMAMRFAGLRCSIKTVERVLANMT